MVKLSPGAVLANEPAGGSEGDVERLRRRLARSWFAAAVEMPVVAALAREVVDGRMDLLLPIEQLRTTFGDLAPTAADTADGKSSTPSWSIIGRIGVKANRPTPMAIANDADPASTTTYGSELGSTSCCPSVA
jgi:hypothetical protein